MWFPPSTTLTVPTELHKTPKLRITQYPTPHIFACHGFKHFRLPSLQLTSGMFTSHSDRRLVGATEGEMEDDDGQAVITGCLWQNHSKKVSSRDGLVIISCVGDISPCSQLSWTQRLLRKLIKDQSWSLGL